MKVFICFARGNTSKASELTSAFLCGGTSLETISSTGKCKREFQMPIADAYTIFCIAGWSDNLQFMKTQLQLKKAAKAPTSGGYKAGKTLTNSGPGNVTLANLTGTGENKTVLIDEYNPLRPNEYSDFKERAREKEEAERREKEREKERERRERERERDRSDDRTKDKDKDERGDRRRRGGSREREDKDRDRDRRRRRDEDRPRDRGRAAIAPPQSLLETTPVNPDLIAKKDGAGTGGFQTSNAVASNIMAKYGWKEGQGLGREEQGLSTCLQVEKTGKRAGKIINKDVEKMKQKMEAPIIQDSPPVMMDAELQNEGNITDMMKNPSKVVLLKNMVGPGEVDDELQPEIEEECAQKYGDISKVIIFEIPGAQEEEAVRIFVEFKRMESAIKALVDLNGRFFGGRTVSAAFYNLDRFRRLDLAG